VVRANLELARRIAARIGQEIEGVVAVALGSSWARGEAHPGSDVDLGLYYRNERRPSIEKLHRLAQELGYRYPTQSITDFGGWGPWINGGAWLQVEGTPVDLLYRELGAVSRVMDGCRAGRFATYYQPGHPHGFHTHIYMGEIHYCRPLHDPDGVLRSLKNAAKVYPLLLKRAVIQNQLSGRRALRSTPAETRRRGATPSTSPAACSGALPAWCRPSSL